MKAKRAILRALRRDGLKRIVDELELTDADRRSAASMRRVLSRSRRATPQLLAQHLSEREVKAACESLGISARGRKKQLLERLLDSHDTPAAGRAAAESQPSNSKQQRMSKRRSTESYEHPEATSLMRPDVGTQAQFRKKKPPVTYRYDSSLAPALEWDGQNPAREEGERLIARVLEASQQMEQLRRRLDQSLSAEELAEVREQLARLQGEVFSAADGLRRLGRPFLDWAGKAERMSFEVPTLPLFVHERLSTSAIIETLTGHRKRPKETQHTFFDIFGDPGHSITDQVLKAYEHQDRWVNRLVLGDSLLVMNSLLHYEHLGGQVQMIYMDPPYGVKFGSNFQPFVRSREVKHNADESLTREPEMVQAYRDTWELGVHSYLTYLRDRLLLCRELLHPTGSIFLQISDENVHHLRELLEEVFGPENFVVSIVVKKKGTQKGRVLDPINDYLLWFARDYGALRDRCTKLYEKVELTSEVVSTFRYVTLPDGRELTLNELSQQSNSDIDYARDPVRVLTDYPGARFFTSENLTSGGFRKNQSVKYEYQGRVFDPGIAKGNCWKHTAVRQDDSPSGLDRLAEAGRLWVSGKQLRYKRYLDDFGFREVTNLWEDVAGASNPEYVVQTSAEVIKRCILMSTLPGDLVLDPTCGSGTTAFVAEQWGRRWITIDASRVPIAIARQRLLTATFPWYNLIDEERGPSGGFAYQRKLNKKGEEDGGLVPHITSTDIANGEPPRQEVLVDRPAVVSRVTRVTGPFCFEATIPTPVDWEADGEEDSGAGAAEAYASFQQRMLEVLRKSPILRLPGNRSVTLHNVRPPAKTLTLSAEAMVDATAPGQQPTLAEAYDEAVEKTKGLLPLSRQPVALVFGPENGAVSEKLVYEAAREAHGKSYTHLYVIGFAIEPRARELIENCEQVMGIGATYVQATPDLMLGDLLKNLRSSQIFSVCGLPEIKLRRIGGKKNGKYQVELVGLDVFDPVSMRSDHKPGADVPAWFLDTDYNDLCFHVCQAFFPRTAAWSNIRKALKGTHDDSVWEHLAGTTSAPFEPGDHHKVAVKVIDDRGNELLVVKDLKEAVK